MTAARLRVIASGRRGSASAKRGSSWFHAKQLYAKEPRRDEAQSPRDLCARVFTPPRLVADSADVDVAAQERVPCVRVVCDHAEHDHLKVGSLAPVVLPPFEHEGLTGIRRAST